MGSLGVSSFKTTIIWLAIATVLGGGLLLADTDKNRLPAYAQVLPSADWWTWWYLPVTDELVLFNAAGIQARIERPHLPDEVETNSVLQMSISPDGSMLIMAETLQNGKVGLGFYALGEGRFVKIHEASPGEQIQLQAAIYDPARDQVAIALKTFTPEAWRVIVFDVKTGDGLFMLHHDDPAVAALDLGLAENAVVAARPVWLHEGVLQLQLWLTMRGIPPGYPAIAWNLAQNTVTPSGYTAVRVDVLPTGQAVFACGPGVYVTLATPDCSPQMTTDEPAPLFTEESGMIESVRWVASGRWLVYEFTSELGERYWKFFYADAKGFFEPTPRQIMPLPEGLLSVRDDGSLYLYSMNRPWEAALLWKLGPPELQLIWASWPGIALGLRSVPHTPALLAGPPTPAEPSPSQTPTEGPIVPPTLFVTPAPTDEPGPTPIPIRITARYQPFEHGFMVEVMGETLFGEQCAYVFSTASHTILMPQRTSGYQYCTAYTGLPENPINEPPPDGLLVPTGNFGRIWGQYEGVQTALGYATAEAFSYGATVPPQTESTLGGGPFYTPIITLPGGQGLYCGTRAATAGNCQVR